MAQTVKNLPAMQRSIPGSGRSPGGRHGNPLQNSCLEKSMDRGAWQATHSSRGHKESDTTEQLALSYFSVLLGEKVFRLRGRGGHYQSESVRSRQRRWSGVGAGEGGWPQGINVADQLLLDCPPLPISLPFLPQSFSSLLHSLRILFFPLKEEMKLMKTVCMGWHCL